jgi:hypothetical protein
VPVSADTPDVIVGVVAIEASSDVTVVGVNDRLVGTREAAA